METKRGGAKDRKSLSPKRAVQSLTFFFRFFFLAFFQIGTCKARNVSTLEKTNFRINGLNCVFFNSG